MIEETQKGKAAYPFCSDFMDGSSRTFCTADKKSVGSCNMVKFSRRIPKIYRNFNEVDGVKSSDLNYASSIRSIHKFITYQAVSSIESNKTTFSTGREHRDTGRLLPLRAGVHVEVEQRRDCAEGDPLHGEREPAGL